MDIYKCPKTIFLFTFGKIFNTFLFYGQKGTKNKNKPVMIIIMKRKGCKNKTT
jgi:uncharacterized protein (DUF486 family)